MSELGMNKMEKNEIMNTNMEDIKMRTVEELIRDKIERMDMTEQEERAFVEYWFKEYEKTGFNETFDGTIYDYPNLDGRPFEVVSRCDEEHYDLQVLPVWNIRFTDNGETFEAYPEEICKLEQNG